MIYCLMEDNSTHLVDVADLIAADTNYNRLINHCRSVGLDKPQYFIVVFDPENDPNHYHTRVLTPFQKD